MFKERQVVSDAKTIESDKIFTDGYTSVEEMFDI